MQNKFPLKFRFWPHLFKCLLVTMALGCTAPFAHAQTPSNDTNRLSIDAFFDIVRQYHPVAKQTQLLLQRASAELTIARGGFDPSFYINSDQKTLDGKNYYTYTNPELKIPTWYGIELKAGLENNTGIYTFSELTPGESSYLGLSVPLAKNLLMDKRRATLKQAQIFKQQSKAERDLEINDLMYDAALVYWDWVQAYQIFTLYEEIIRINENRFSLIKNGFLQGDRPAIDTIEALAQLQQFQFLKQEAFLKFRNTGIELSNFLWTSNNAPYDLPPSVLPVSNNLDSLNLLSVPNLEELLLAAQSSHPQLQLYQFKQQSLEIDRKLKFQSLLPTVNVKANLINKGYDVFKGFNNTFISNNNKFGIDIGLPLRLSEGRGGYQLAKIKLKDNQLTLQLKQQQIAVKLKQYYYQGLALKEQANTYDKATRNFQTLLRGEETRFRIGESSLFLLNTRENKVLEAQQKLTELLVKWQKNRYTLEWAAGRLK